MRKVAIISWVGFGLWSGCLNGEESDREGEKGMRDEPVERVYVSLCAKRTGQCSLHRNGSGSLWRD